MRIEPGLQIRDYRIISALGKGGMGEVWLAEDVHIQRKLAIKALAPELAADSSLVERFLQEAKLQAHLQHPGLVSIIGFFAYEDSYLLCMEYAEGITIRELIHQIGPIPAERSIPIILQILRTLEFIHKEGIVHRDIKPSNIMIDPKNKDRVKIMDFGIAKAVGSQHLTRSGTTIGSPLYMSPEQVLHANRLDHRTDIFSLGITLYEMLSGKLPYQTDTESDYSIQKQIVEQALPNPKNFYPHIPDSIVPIIYKMCDKDENKRYQSCSEIIEELMQSGVAAETKTSTPVQVSTPSMPSPAPVSAAHSGKLQIPKPVQERPFIAPGEKKKIPGFALLAGVAGLVVIIAVLILLVLKPGKEKVSATTGIDPGYFVKVEGGSFMMGSSSSREADEKPLHQVNVNSFFLAKAELTQSEWDALMPRNPSNILGPSLPVSQVSWNDAIEYCNRRSKAEGLKPCYSISGDDNPGNWSSGRVECDWTADGYRLPTEAEWEFAARGGTLSRGYSYPGSNDANEVCWYSGNSGATMRPVMQLKPNELGLYDIGGNITEWCWDWYDARYYSYSPSDNPLGAEGGEDRVQRGGSWKYPASSAKASNREYDFPFKGSLTNGLRLCRTAQ